MYIVGQQPAGIVPMMPGNPAVMQGNPAMMQGNMAGVVPNTGTGMMAGYQETTMQSSARAVMQMNMGVSVQQQNMVAAMSGSATATSQVCHALCLCCHH